MSLSSMIEHKAIQAFIHQGLVIEPRARRASQAGCFFLQRRRLVSGRVQGGRHDASGDLAASWGWVLKAHENRENPLAEAI